jgi:hypothetical protein
VRQLTLRECLQRGTADLARRFFTGSAQPIEQAWARSQSHESTRAIGHERSTRARLRGRIVKAALIAAASDATVAERLLRVAHLIDPPARLNDPKLLLRVVVANARDQYSRFGTARRPGILGRSTNAVMPA